MITDCKSRTSSASILEKKVNFFIFMQIKPIMKIFMQIFLFSNRLNKVASNVNNARPMGMQNQRPYQNSALQMQKSAVPSDSSNEIVRVCNEVLTTFRQDMQQIMPDAKSAFSTQH